MEILIKRFFKYLCKLGFRLYVHFIKSFCVQLFMTESFKDFLKYNGRHP